MGIFKKVAFLLHGKPKVKKQAGLKKGRAPDVLLKAIKSGAALTETTGVETLKRSGIYQTGSTVSRTLRRLRAMGKIKSKPVCLKSGKKVTIFFL